MVDISDINIDNAISAKNTTVINIEGDKRIELLYLKQGKAKRTYMYGLEFFLVNQKEMTSYIKNLQKELATGMVENTDEYGRKRVGFNGKKCQAIKELLIHDLKISADKIDTKEIG